MAAAELLPALVEATLASSAAIVLVLALRLPLQRGFGAGVAYALWLLVPVALLAVTLPPAVAPLEWGRAVSVTVLPAISSVGGRMDNVVDYASWCIVAWAVGVVLSLAWSGAQQLNFLRSLGPLQRRDDGVLQARAVAGLPAVIGWWAPAIVVPADFDARYSPQQCELMRAHERGHIRHGDLHWNALATLLRALFWFNPLLHFAAQRFRDDQELACDARVIAHHPHARRAYGEAMLKTQLAEQPLPLGCHWGQTHPLKERIAMLNQPLPSLRRWIAGSALVASLSIMAGVAAWAAQPAASPVAGKEAGWVSVRMRVFDAEGKVVQSPEVINRLGAPFSLSYGRSEQDPDKVALNMVASRQGDGRIVVNAEVRDKARTISRPRIVLTDSQPAMFDLQMSGATDPKNNGWRIELDASTRPDRVKMPDKFVPHGAAATRVDAPLPRTPAPKYPEEAAAKGIGGKVMLLVDIDANGRPSQVLVESAQPEGVFDAATVEAAKQWRFQPEMKDGKAIPSRIRVPVTFEPPAFQIKKS